MKHIAKLNLARLVLALSVSLLGAQTAAPTRTVVDVNNTWVDCSCDVPFYNHVEGTIRFLTFTDSNGNVRRQVNTVSLAFTTTNPITGQEYPFRQAGAENIYYAPNGDIVYTAHANFDRLIVKGEGAVWNNVGYLQLIFPADGGDPVATFHGNWDSLDDLCAVWHSLSQ
jgi:hypothetical protein